jgi:molybdopterin-guanine dinucleotide biosynthesis protein A
MTGIILAGGRNSRMGRDKASLPWQDSDFLHTILQKLSTVCSELIVVSNTLRNENIPGVRFVADIIPQRGPLSGIHAGLSLASSQLSFVTACDMPYIVPEAVSYLAAFASGWDVVVPVSNTYLEPLFACYAKNCVPAIEALFRDNNQRTQALFSRVHCRTVPVEALQKFDPTLRLLRNINSPEDYQSALLESANWTTFN